MECCTLSIVQKCVSNLRCIFKKYCVKVQLKPEKFNRGYLQSFRHIYLTYSPILATTASCRICGNHRSGHKIWRRKPSPGPTLCMGAILPSLYPVPLPPHLSPHPKRTYWSLVLLECQWPFLLTLGPSAY